MRKIRSIAAATATSLLLLAPSALWADEVEIRMSWWGGK